jgi:hypothetical protein
MTHVNKRRSAHDKGQTVEEPDDSETVTSGSEAERRGRLRRLG